MDVCCLSKHPQQLGWSNIGKLWVVHNVMILGLATGLGRSLSWLMMLYALLQTIKTRWKRSEICVPGWCSNILSVCFALLYIRYFINNRPLLFLAETSNSRTRMSYPGHLRATIASHSRRWSPPARHYLPISSPISHWLVHHAACQSFCTPTCLSLCLSVPSLQCRCCHFAELQAKIKWHLFFRTRCSCRFCCEVKPAELYVVSTAALDDVTIDAI